MRKENRWVVDEPQTLYQAIDESHQVDVDFRCYEPEYSDDFRKVLEQHSNMLGDYLQKLQDEIEKPFSPGGDYE